MGDPRPPSHPEQSRPTTRPPPPPTPPSTPTALRGAAVGARDLCSLARRRRRGRARRTTPPRPPPLPGAPGARPGARAPPRSSPPLPRSARPCGRALRARATRRWPQRSEPGALGCLVAASPLDGLGRRAPRSSLAPWLAPRALFARPALSRSRCAPRPAALRERRPLRRCRPLALAPSPAPPRARPPASPPPPPPRPPSAAPPAARSGQGLPCPTGKPNCCGTPTQTRLCRPPPTGGAGCAPGTRG